MRKLIIFGASGNVGKYLYDYYREKNWKVLGTHHKNTYDNTVQFSLENGDLDTLLNEESFDYALICSAFTNFDMCKKDRKKAYSVNSDGPKKLITNLLDRKIIPIFCSTDSIFGGGSGNYKENDTPCPNSVYGETKLEVENFINSNFANDVLITRFAKIFTTDPTDNTLFSEWARQLANRDKIKIIQDQFFNPTWIDDVARALSVLMDKEATGIYHLCQPHGSNRKPLLKDFASFLGYSNIDYEEVPSSTFNFFDNRNKNTILDSSKFINETNFQFTSFQNIFQLFANKLSKTP